MPSSLASYSLREVMNEGPFFRTAASARSCPVYPRQVEPMTGALSQAARGGLEGSSP